MSFSPRSSESQQVTAAPANDIHRNASGGALVAIVVILTMIVVGAFYAWGKRVAEERGLGAAAIQSFTATTTTHSSY
jgi:uncharacterized protein HemX